MKCPDCRTDVPVSKSLSKGRSTYPDECPSCGAELEKEDTSPTRLEK